MPTIATKTSVLDGRAEVVSYARDSSAFYVRVRIPEKRGYRSRRIDGATCLPDALDKALDAYMSLGAPSDPKPPRRGTKEGAKVFRTSSGVFEHIECYLKEMQRKCDSGLIKSSTFRRIQVTLLNHLRNYLIHIGINKASQIKVGTFDRYQIWRIDQFSSRNISPPSNHTLKKEAAGIGQFINYLAKNRLLDPFEASQAKNIPPKVKLFDTDFDSNPPIRDNEEWMLIMHEVLEWVEESRSINSGRTLILRQLYMTFLLVLKQTGMRPNEARGLRWRDIETEDIGRYSEAQWEKDMVFYQLQDIHPETDLNPEDRESIGRVSRYVTHIRILQSKTKSTREVTSNSAEPLAQWKRWQNEYVAERKSNKRIHGYCYDITEDDLVFGIPESDEVSITNYNTFNIYWRDIMSRCQSRLKGPLMSTHKYTMYSLRSTRAQEMMDLGVDVYLAATQLGHSVAILEKVYARLPQRRRATKEAAHIEFGKRKNENKMVSLDEVREIRA